MKKIVLFFRVDCTFSGKLKDYINKINFQEGI
jgi:hypothetical protein